MIRGIIALIEDGEWYVKLMAVVEESKMGKSYVGEEYANLFDDLMLPKVCNNHPLSR